MKSCPHCQFLVADGAENCAVCKQPVAMPSQPAGPWGVDPGPGFGDTPPLPVSQARPQAASTGRFVSPRRTTSGGAGKVLAIVAASVLGVVIFGAAGLAFIGTTSTPDRIDAAAVTWQTYRDPAGVYSIELPGAPLDAAPMMSEMGAPDGAINGALTDSGGFSSGVFVYTLPPGTIPDLEAGLDGFASGSFSEYTVTRRTPVETPFGSAIDMEVVGTLRETNLPGITFVRSMGVSGTPYMFFTLAPSSSSPEAAEIHQRMVDSFATPPAG